MDFVSENSGVALFNFIRQTKYLLKLWFNLERNSVVLRTVPLPVHGMKAYGRVEV
jgi:hypothetical protein